MTSEGVKMRASDEWVTERYAAPLPEIVFETLIDLSDCGETSYNHRLTTTFDSV